MLTIGSQKLNENIYSIFDRKLKSFYSIAIRLPFDAFDHIPSFFYHIHSNPTDHRGYEQRNKSEPETNSKIMFLRTYFCLY